MLLQALISLLAFICSFLELDGLRFQSMAVFHRLVGFIHESNNFVQANGFTCGDLGYQGARAAVAVPGVSKALTDEKAIVRIAAGYALARMEKPARAAVPDMLRAVLESKEEGLMRPAQQALAYSLGYAPGKYAPLYFSGVLPNLSEDGNPLEGVDRKLLYGAVTKLLQDPSGRVRGCGAYTLKFFTPEDLAAMPQPIYDAVKAPAPNYAMFDDDPRQHGLDLMARLHIEEGVPLCFETLVPKKWGQGVRLSHRFQTFRQYGGAAKSVLSPLKELRWTLRSGDHRQFLEDAIRAIEADKNPRSLVSLHTLVDERFARDLSPAKDDRQRVRLCRRLMKANPSDYFYQAAGLRRLASILKADAWDDILPLVGHSDDELRNAVAKIGGQLPGEDVTHRWIEELSQSRGERAAAILDVLARRGGPKSLRAIKQHLAHEDVGVRNAAIRAAAMCGGEKELPLLIESLVAIPASDDQPAAAAEQAVVSVCRRARNAEPATTIIMAMLADATPKAKASLLRVLGQLDGAKPFDAITAAVGDEDAGISQAAVDALAASPDRRATDRLLTMIADPPTRRTRNSAFTSCLKRVVVGRVPQGQKTSVLERLLVLDGQGRNGAAALGELRWSPSIASLRLAQSYLDKQGLTKPAAEVAVAIAQQLDPDDSKQRAAAVEVLKEVLAVTDNETTSAAAQALIDQLGQ